MKHATGAALQGSAAISHGIVYFTSGDGYLVCIERFERPRWVAFQERVRALFLHRSQAQRRGASDC